MGGFITSNQTDAIAASWERCARQYKLRQDSGRPIPRLQSSEVAPRLEQIVESTGGRQGFFRHLASVAGEIGHCLVVTDADGVSVRIEHSGATSGMASPLGPVGTCGWPVQTAYPWPCGRGTQSPCAVRNIIFRRSGSLDVPAFRCWMPTEG